jgi:hypothetical protein
MKTDTIDVVDKQGLLFRIAATLLCERRELPVEDLRAIPLVDSQQTLSEVVNHLLTEFNAEVVQRSVTNKPFLRWEQVIRLRD